MGMGSQLKVSFPSVWSWHKTLPHNWGDFDGSSIPSVIHHFQFYIKKVNLFPKLKTLFIFLQKCELDRRFIFGVGLAAMIRNIH